MTSLVNVADQSYPRAPDSPPDSMPVARDVRVTAAPRPPRVGSTYRPRAAEVRVDPQLRRAPDREYQVVGEAGTVPGKLELGPGPVAAPSPSREDVHIVPLGNPAVPGRYAGPDIPLDQRPAASTPDFYVGRTGATSSGDIPEQSVSSTPQLPVADVFLMPRPPSEISGRYRGPDKVVAPKTQSLPPVINVLVADQVIGRHP